MKNITIIALFAVAVTLTGVGLSAFIPLAFADHPDTVLEPYPRSGTSGCEQTDEGCYNKPIMTVAPGAIITFSNTDNVIHTITSGSPADGPSGVFDSGLIMVGDTYKFTIYAEGTYDHYCLVHPWRTGKIIVDAGHGGQVENTQKVAAIPDWIRDVASFWAQGLISDTEYVGTLSYLAAEGILAVPASAPTPEPEPTCDEIFSEYYLYKFAFVGVYLPYVDNPTTWGADSALQPLRDMYVERGSQLSDELDDTCSPQRLSAASAELEGINVALEMGLVLMEAANAGKDVLAMVDSVPEPKQTCSLFCDSTGYEPQWAKGMGEFQAQMKCLQSISDAYGTPDSNWCVEFSGYTLDQANDPAPESIPTSANFDFDIIKCASDEFGWFTEIKVKAINLSPHGFESIKFILGGKDASGNIVDFTSDYEFDVRPGATLYLDSMIDASPEIRSCFVEIESYD